MREILRDLEATARTIAPDLVARSVDPATDAQIDKLRIFIGRDSLPQELIDLFRWKNGGDGDAWFGGGGFWCLRSIDSIVNLTTEWRKHRMDLTSGTADESIEIPSDGIWPREWVPFVDWNSDVFAVVDCGNPAGTVVLGVDLEGGHVIRWADSLTQFFDYVRSLRREGQELDIDLLMAGEAPTQLST